MDCNRPDGCYTRVPLYRELGISYSGFNSLLRGMDEHGCCVLLESAGRTKKLGRFSFLCFNPGETVTASSRGVKVSNETGEFFYEGEDIFTWLDSRIKEHVSPGRREFGDFNGGYAGYIGAAAGIQNGVDDTPFAELIRVDDFLVLTTTQAGFTFRQRSMWIARATLKH